MGQGHGHRIVSAEGNPACDHFKHGDTQRIQIAPFIAVSASGLLRRDVVDRAHHCGIHGLGGNGPGYAKIRHLHLAVHGDQHVLGLDIPVDDVLFVGSLNALGHLDGNADGLLHIQTSFFCDIAF